jgi:hypothetical protein
MSDTITDEQIAAHQQKKFEAEMKAQDACKKALVALAESHGFVIVALPMASAERTIVVVAADWGLQRK